MPQLTPDEAFQKKVDHVLAAEARLDKKVSAHQRKMYELIVDEYLPLFDTKDGVIANSRKNDRLLNTLDNLFDRLEKALYRDVLGPFASSLLESASLSGQYYVAMGFKKTIIDGVLRNKIRLEDRIGITPTGRVKKKGYLYNLGKTDQVRQQLKNYVLTNLTGDVSFLDFQLGFRNLVIGNKRVKGLETTGALQKYFDQYAYDSFNQLDSVANKQFADELNLKHFIYEGSTIATSRAFCRKRAGKAFSVEETKTWKDDPTLIDKKRKASYRPLIDRGRYRCRHFIKYITETLFNSMRGITSSDA